ncbi:MAG: glycine--tRNA ligase [Deltaproteobacteria bacterium]|nr:glycine--tRNA ligase [Deltaproteobacteria bacterium]MBW2414416.1 glycine--tRNA ligase [Deltaproteobacteria bacterium]
MAPKDTMDKLVALCLNRGFVYPSSEIYGGIAGFWDYGPLGCEMRNEVKAAWWQRMVRDREDVVGLDTSIIANPQTWVASGHVENFHDPMVDCRQCKRRFRADQVDDDDRCKASEDGRHDLTEPKQFNLMLKTRIGASDDTAIDAYLRAETCQSIFLDFKRAMQSARKKPPFGIAQIGKAFRNEITPRNFTFRSREFEQMELEFFCPPDQADDWFEHFRERRWQWHLDMGVDPEKIRWHEHTGDELAHYCQRAYDIEFEFPFGWHEFEGIHHRGDHDLTAHSNHSGKDQAYTDPETKERYVPYVIETSVGVDRTMLVLLCNGYTEDEVAGEKRTLLKLSPRVAPVKVAVLPLSKKIAEPAERIAADLRRRFNTAFDVTGNIGRRYRRQDEIGTPYCVTYDFDSSEDDSVTVRDRDTTKQERISISALPAYLSEKVLGY